MRSLMFHEAASFPSCFPESYGKLVIHKELIIGHSTYKVPWHLSQAGALSDSLPCSEQEHNRAHRPLPMTFRVKSCIYRLTQQRKIFLGTADVKLFPDTSLLFLFSTQFSLVNHLYSQRNCSSAGVDQRLYWRQTYRWSDLQSVRKTF